MPVKEIINLNECECIPVFCFNKDFKRLAISPNNNEVCVYSEIGGTWKLESTLKEHSERVTGIDWAKNTNRILTCGADRNAYVWAEEKPKEWKPSLVILRIDRAAITAKWAPSETKFAVGTGSKVICLCYYEESNDWWVSKHIKKPIRSSVLCIDWHPSGTAIAAGSSDFCARIFSAGIKEIEKKPEATCWGDKVTFGALLFECKTMEKGWVHSVSFSPSGNKLAWVSHDCTISVADSSGSQPITCVVRLENLPFQACLFVTENIILAAGHDNSPYKYAWDGKNIKIEGDIDTLTRNKSSQPAEISAMSKFRNLDKLAQASGVVSASSKKTHANTITYILKPY
ncbi:hypothetical protein HZS_487, partial [Henneguya salminicola]